VNQRVTDDSDSIVGMVGSNVIYAKFQELGFTGSQNVRQSLRTIKQAFGKTIKGGPVTFTVQAHTRNVNYPAHSFLASSLKELEPEFKASIQAATKRAIK
jgi:phage gpG-like protein